MRRICRQVRLMVGTNERKVVNTSSEIGRCYLCAACRPLCAQASATRTHRIATGVRVWPPDINMRSAREEAEMVIYASVREALAKCRLRPSQV
jgi:hypothetical protein